MSWNPSLPADSSKIRLSAGMIRANWSALQNGTFPCVYLQLAQQGVNPTRADSTGWVFGKDPGSGITELHYEDSQNPAKVIQITNNGAIGNSSVDLFANRITFNNGTTYLNKNHQVLGWLRVESNGTATATSGDMTVANLGGGGTGNGRYVVSFTLAASSSYVAMVQISSASAASSLSRRSCTVTNRTNNSFLVTIYSNSTGDPEAEDFMVIVFGGR